MDAASLPVFARGHGGLHRGLDVQFQEDDCRLAQEERACRHGSPVHGAPDLTESWNGRVHRAAARLASDANRRSWPPHYPETDFEFVLGSTTILHSLSNCTIDQAENRAVSIVNFNKCHKLQGA